MKILFIQLPLVDHQHGYINGNIDYAPALISSFIQKNFSDIECETLPSAIANFCSDQTIVKYAESLKPDIIAFTSYLWNVERNIRISRILRENLDSALIIFGGPEISEGSIALNEHNTEIDIFVSGEGEWFFRKFLNGMDINYSEINGNTVAVQPVNELIRAEEIVEPLSNGRLNAMADGSVFMEMTRGCPYRCSYCYYSKNNNIIRELPFSALTDVIKKRNDIKEIYILSPTFDRSKEFISNLKILKKMNHSVKLHTEIRTDRITSETADLMFDAGFHSLEVGLQSLNKRALDNINRDSDPESELKGMENLVNAGIDLKIGIIPGLPGDDEESFKKTVDVLCDRGLGDFIELYPLMILPGTAIREKAVKDGVIFQNKPPYYFLEGWNFRSDQIRKISDYIEDKSEMSPVIFYLPDFTDGENPDFARGVILDGNQQWSKINIKGEVDTVVADIHIHVKDRVNFTRELKRFIKDADTTRLYNIIIYSNLVLEDNVIYQTVKNEEIDNLYRRQNVFSSFREGSIFHFFQLTDRLDTYYEMENSYDFITPAMIVNENSINSLLNSGQIGIPLIIDFGMYDQIKEFIINEYRETPEYIAFRNEKEMQEFYSEIEVDLVKLPFSFGLKKF